jgi:selenocysteine lyase/cysteine desulfurase
MDNINGRVKNLSGLILSEFAKLFHDSGLPLIKLYGPGNTEDRGGTFLFNLFDVSGRQYPFEFVEEMANAEMISCRTGCFCNPGIDELNHCLSPEQLKTYFVSRDHGDYNDFVNFTRKARGGVRISVGLATTKSDLEKFIRFLKKFLNKTARQFNPY